MHPEQFVCGRERCQEILAGVEPFRHVVRIISDMNFSPTNAMNNDYAEALLELSEDAWVICSLNCMWASDEEYDRIRQDAAELTRVFKTAIKKLGMHA